MRPILILLSVFILAIPSTDSRELPVAMELLWSKECLQDLTSSRTMGSPLLIEPGRAGVVFISNSRLLAYEVAYNNGKLSSRKGPDVASAFHLHLFLIDASTGASVLAKDWGTRPRESSVQVTKDKILLRTGTALRLLSSGLTEERQLALPHPDPYEGWETRPSPDGDTLVLNHYMRVGRQNLSELELLDGETLEVKNRRTTVPWVKGETFASSNTVIALNENQRTPSHIILSTFDDRVWKQLWNVPETGCVGRFTFVNDTTIAYACGRGLWSVPVTGQPVLVESFQKGDGLGPDSKFSVSQDGKSLALLLENFSDPWDTGIHVKTMHIAVYDFRGNKRRLTIDVKPLAKTDFDLALSPDGSKLAVLNDRTVTVYSIH